MPKKLSVKEMQAEIEKFFEESKDETIAEIVAGYGDDIKGILQGLEDYGKDLNKFFPDIKHIDTDSCKGDGSEAYMVFKHLPTDTLFGLEGWYASGEGFEWEGDFKLMEPYTVTHYKGKKGK